MHLVDMVTPLDERMLSNWLVFGRKKRERRERKTDVDGNDTCTIRHADRTIVRTVQQSSRDG